MVDILELCDRIRQTAYEVHVYLGNGHLEKVYENALVHRLLINFGSPRFEIRKFVVNNQT
jgi:hypothetical protein